MSHCIHYGTCGGCAFASRIAIDKRALLVAALPGAPVAPLIETPLRSRRRMDLSAVRQGPVVLLGLHEARSNMVVDMTECVLLEPRLFALVAPLRELLRHVEGFRRAGSAIVNWLDEGPDILLRLDYPLTGPDRTKLIAFAKTHFAARISLAKGDGEAELVAMLRPPVLTLSGVPVTVAPGAFLQAGEAAIVAAVLAGLPKLKPKARIVELFAGIGTLSFALGKHARVEAYEGNADAVAAQDGAIRRANLAGMMRVTARDLARQPLKTSEMAGAAAVVLDPPFAGAGHQMKNLAASGVVRIIYVSCNPAALSRDAFLLHQSGYTVMSATPIDQFPFSENVESVTVFASK
jgi:23S rRNA (uracil1939-C5)-methyltransferase